MSHILSTKKKVVGMRRERWRLCLWWTGCECVFETILTPWSIQNTVLSQEEKFTNLKKSDSRGSTAPEHLIFSRRPVPTSVTERRLKRTKRKNLLTSRQQKNTFGKHWEKQKGFWFRDTKITISHTRYGLMLIVFQDISTSTSVLKKQPSN